MKNISKILESKGILLIYALISAIFIVIYSAFHLIFYKIDWNKYETNGDYYLKVQKIMQTGVLRIGGNTTAIHSVFLISVLLLGIILSALIFWKRWKNYSKQTFMPLISLIGFVLPFLLANAGNLILILLLSYFVIFVGSLFTFIGL